MPAEIVDSAKRSVDARCHSTSCNDSGCLLQLAGAPQPNVLISLESQYSPADKAKAHCDYLFVGGPDDEDGGPWLALIELGKKSASALLAQLRGGVSVAEGLLPGSVQVKFKPIYAHAGIPRYDYEVLRKNSSKVRFGNANVLVTTVRSGDRLVDALKK